MRILTQNNSWIIGLLAVTVGFSACKTQKNTTAVASAASDVEEVVEAPIEAETLKYQASNTRTFDLIHTTLDVRFDWEKQQLSGKAELTLKPYFYATNKLTLDAKGFDLLAVSMKKDGKLQSLKYTYDNKKIYIELDKKCTRNENLTIVLLNLVHPPYDIILVGLISLPVQGS